MLKQSVNLLLNDISQMEAIFVDLCTEEEQVMMKLKRLSVKKYEVVPQISSIAEYGQTWRNQVSL